MTSKKKKKIKNCESIYLVKCLNYLRNFTTYILRNTNSRKLQRLPQYNDFCAIF